MAQVLPRLKVTAEIHRIVPEMRMRNRLVWVIVRTPVPGLGIITMIQPRSRHRGIPILPAIEMLNGRKWKFRLPAAAAAGEEG